jgi:hypothetical protein
MSDIRTMIGNEVIVTANGIQYSGVLVEVSDTEVHLKGLFQWITLPAESVGDIKLSKAATTDLAGNAGEE